MFKHPCQLWLGFLVLLCCLIASANDPQLPLAPSSIDVLLEGLQDPAFLAIDADNSVFISEEQAGRILQRLADGRVVSLIEGLKKPQGVAVSGDETLFIAAGDSKGVVPQVERGSALDRGVRVQKADWLGHRSERDRLWPLWVRRLTRPAEASFGREGVELMT